MEHHVPGAGGPAEPRDVVPLDEGIRISGLGAPRPRRRRPGWAQGRGASRRRNKDFRALEHHVRGAGGPDGLRDVVLPDEGIRICGP